MNTAEATIERIVNLARTLTPTHQAELIGRIAVVMSTAVAEKEERPPTPRRSARGALAHLGTAPTAEEIDEVRREMWANFPREDI